jgi:DNA-binding HxlR family transcriptional regulator
MKKEIHSLDFCPVARVAELLGDACSLLIVRDLLTGDKRFKDFEHSLSPISSRTITKKLKLLEARKIIIRTAFKERPPRVEYSLTQEGKHLNKIIQDMRIFGQKYLHN